ncbi:MAG: hypothetical protein H6Q74_1823 [Firmicutes bacterium]|nr:hypothetical protein [Bacillota bacterium]
MKEKEMLDQITYLRDLTRKTRLDAAQGYKYFLIWGIVVILGYISTLWYQPYMIWPAAVSVGIMVHFSLEKPYNHSQSLAKRLYFLALVLAIAAFLVFGLLIIRTSDPIILNAYWPFQVGVIYIATGIFIGRDFILVGCWFILSTLASLYLSLPLQNIWLAISCGGCLVLTGLFLRKRVVRGD